MLYIAAGLILIAALLGAYLLSYILQNKNTPKGVAMTHGSIAATGLLLLVFYALLYSPAPIISIVIFVIAALGGFTLIYLDLTGKHLPKWLAVGHGLIALTGFIFLLVYMFTEW